MKKAAALLRFPYLPLWAAAFLLLAPIYLAGKAIFWGTPLLQFAPWWTFAWETLFAGRLPLWNYQVGMGAPLLANYQSGLLYPPHWIYGLLYALGGPRLLAWGMAPLAALHLAWSGLGMALLVRRLGLNAAAQAVSGLAFGLSGYLVARLGFLSINAAAAWLPWLLLCLTPPPGKAVPERTRFPWLAVCAALLLLAGHAQTAWYILLLGGAWSVFWAWNNVGSPQTSGNGNRGGWRLRLAQIVRAEAFYGLALLLAIGVAAAQLLPTAEYLAQSQRAAAVEYEYALNYSFWHWHLLTLLAPGLFGSPASGDYWGYANVWEDAIYVGLLPLLLAASAALGSFRRKPAQPRRALIWFLLTLCGVSLLLALGKFTPIYPWLFQNVPTFDMFQAPARWMLWGVFSLALLAAIGADGWRRPRGWGLYWTRLGALGAVAVSLGAGLAWVYLGEISPSFIRSTAMLGVLGVGVGVLSLSAPPRPDAPAAQILSPPADKPRPHSRLFQLAPPAEQTRPPDKPYRLSHWQWAVALFVAADLVTAGVGLNPGETLDLYGQSPAAMTVRAQLGTRRLYFPPRQEEWLKYTRFMRFETFDPGEEWLNLRRVMLPNTNLLDGISTVSNFDPFVPGRFADWLVMLEQAPPLARERMLGLMNLGAVVERNRQEASGVRLYPMKGGWAWLVPCAVSAAAPAEARARVLRGEVDFQAQAVIEGWDGSEEGFCGAAEPAAQAADPQIGRIERVAQLPNRYELDLNLTAPGWLVISEVWYPGWKAAVDGKAVPILRANYLFQAVRVLPGQRRLILTYRPVSFFGGAALSLAALGLLAALWRHLRGTHG